MLDFYQTPVLYDIIHTPGTAAEVDGLERIALDFVRTRSRVLRWLEPACGSGRYLRVAAARGTNVVGFDLSEAMVDYAARRLEKVTEAPDAGSYHVFQADMTDFAEQVGSGRIDLAFNLINTIRHLPDDESMLTHFEHVAATLKRGGVYAVGLSTSLYGAEFPVEDIWRARRGPCHVTQVIQYLPPVTKVECRARREHVFSHFVVTRPSETTHHDTSYHLRCYDVKQWNDLLARSPFEVIATVDEEGLEYEPTSPGYGVYLLQVRG